MQSALHRLFLSLLVVQSAVQAQQAMVTLHFSAKPLSSVTDQLANARDLGPWLVLGCLADESPTVAQMPWERVAMAGGDIPFIDPETVALVLASHVRRSPASQTVRVLSYGLMGVSIAVPLLAGRGNTVPDLQHQVRLLKWGAAASTAGMVLPTVIDYVKGQIPDTAGLVSQVKYPITLAPGRCFHDTFYARKMPASQLKARTVVIPAGQPRP